MPHLPIMLDLSGKTAIVVGGGKIAARKCLGLIRAEANIIVIAPETTVGMKRLINSGRVMHREREFMPTDLKGASIVFAATDNPEVNLRIANEAASTGLLANAVDMPARSSFQSPAVVRRGGLTLTVATEGGAPTLAKQLRKELSSAYGREYGEVVRIISKVREKLLTKQDNRAYNKRILHSLASGNLPTLIRNRSYSEIDNLLQELCGAGFSLAEMGLKTEDYP